MGPDVLPLSVDDSGWARTTCGCRALVSADKGNDPQRVKLFEELGAGLVVRWLAPC